MKKVVDVFHRVGRIVTNVFFRPVQKGEKNENLALIQSSGLFNEAWYLAHYQDVAQAKVDPLLHYLLNGGFEGRDPGPGFSSNWYIHTYLDGKKDGINPLVHYLKYGKDKGCKLRPDPIIVHQMGKVGSKTVELSLQKAYKNLGIEVSIYHTHALAGFEERRQSALRQEQLGERSAAGTFNALKYGENVRKKIDEDPNQHWDIISLVRDPIARNVGSFFYNLSEYMPGWREQYANKTLSLDEMQSVFLTMFPPLSGLDHWFEEQMKAVPAFDIDVYKVPFPCEIGYKIYHGDFQADLLLIRLENLEQCAEHAMRDFLGLQNFTIHNTNLGEEKEYAELYRAFKKKPLPIEYVQRIYNMPLSRHFYTDAELRDFAKHWTGLDILELA